MAVVVAYVALGVGAYWSAIPDLSGRLTGSNADFAQSVWFIGWVPHAVDHWLNPFFSNAMYVPTGFNLAENTASPFLGLVTYPISLLAGPLVSANLLMVLAMPVSAAAAFVVLRKWNVWGPAAVLGGAIYGFSPYMVGQGLGHVELIFIPIPPLVALTLEAIIHRRGSPRRLGIQLGALMVVQYLVSPEVALDVTLLSIAALVCIAIRTPAGWRTMARDAVKPMMIAIGMVAVVLAYPLWMLLAGPQHYAGPTQPLSNPYYNDLLSFVVPSRLQRLSFGVPPNWGGGLDANGFVTIEADGYIGIPLLLITAGLAWRSRHRPRMQLTVVLLVVAAGLSLGSSLYVAGKATHIPLPFAVLKHVPVVNDILPSRISFATDALIAAAIAFGLDDVHRDRTQRRAPIRGGRRMAAGLAAVVTLLVLVVSQLPSWPYESPSASTLPASMERALPLRDPITITYPYPPVVLPLLWQATTGYSFRLVGGDARHSNAPGSGAGTSISPIPMNPPELQQFLLSYDELGLYTTNPSAQLRSMVIGPRLLNATRSTLSRYGVQVVIVDRTHAGALQVVKLFERVLGPPNKESNSYAVWVDVHRVLREPARGSSAASSPPRAPTATHR